MSAPSKRKTERIQDLSRKSGASYLPVDSCGSIASDLAYF